MEPLETMLDSTHQHHALAFGRASSCQHPARTGMYRRGNLPHAEARSRRDGEGRAPSRPHCPARLPISSKLGGWVVRWLGGWAVVWQELIQTNLPAPARARRLPITSLFTNPKCSQMPPMAQMQTVSCDLCTIVPIEICEQSHSYPHFHSREERTARLPGLTRRIRTSIYRSRSL